MHNSLKNTKNFKGELEVSPFRKLLVYFKPMCKKYYPAFLIGVLFMAATAFSILSYKQRKGNEAFFVSKANILGEKAGSVSATATTSAQVSELSLVSSVSSTKPAAKPNSVPSKSGFPININTADITTLDLLPGIGPATAKKIIDYRIANGPFRNVADLLNVNGIGEKKLAQLKGLVKVGE